MRKFIALAVFGIAVCGPVFAQQNTAQPQRDEALTKGVDTALRAAGEITPGMTRLEVLKNFATEGGLSSRNWNHYVYRLCPYIKIDVTFAIPASADFSVEELTDKVATVSRPYLQYSIFD